MFRTQHKIWSVSFPFLTLAAFLIVVFLTGGASRIDAQSLLVLRPASVLFCAIALLTLKREHFDGRKLLFGWIFAVLLLALIHLVPLPPGLWRSLPGRTLLTEIDQLAQLGEVWRPLSITPMGTWHALASLAAPLAVLLLAIQLDRDELYRLLGVLLGLGALSGLIGLLQVVGSPDGPLYFYRITNNGSAVGLFANRNHSATLLVAMLPMLAVYASISEKHPGRRQARRMVAGLLGIVLIPLILVTGSRAGLFLGAISLVAAALLYRQPVDNRAGLKSNARFNLGRTQLVGSVAVISLILMTIFFSRAEAIDRLFARSVGGADRQDFWKVSLELVWKYFPAGSGVGSFVEAYQIDEPSRLLNAAYVNHVHNDWIEIALTTGLLGIVLLVFAAIAFFVGSIGAWRSGDASRRSVLFARMASVILAIMGLASIFDYPLRTPTMMCVGAICLLWFVEPRRSSTVSAEQGNDRSTTVPHHGRRKPGWASFRSIMERIGVRRLVASTVVALLGGWLILALAVSGVTRTKAPATALKLGVKESVALASLADQLFFTNPVNPPAEVRRLAIAALRQQAVNAKALRVLGFGADAEGNASGAERLIGKAAALSRREPGAQLWLIEAKSRRGDVSGTLSHYDTVLRTRPENEATLFPRLLNAMDDAEIRLAFAPYVRSDKIWVAGFLNYAISNSKNLPALVSLLSETNGLPDVDASRSQEQQLLSRLVAEKNFSAARRIFTLIPKTQMGRLSDARFSKSDISGFHGPLGWQVFQDPDAGGGFAAAAGSANPVLSVYANPATTRRVASRLLYLEPGIYNFVSQLQSIDPGDGGNLRWQLRCPSTVTSGPVWSIDAGRSRRSAQLSIAANCPVQFLDLIASGGKVQGGIEATVKDVSITAI